MSSAWAPSARIFFGPLPSPRMDTFCMLRSSARCIRFGWRGLRLPHLPRDLAARIEVLEKLLVLERVQTRPETVVRVGEQLARGGEALERFRDQFLPGPHPVEDLPAKDEETTVDSHPHVLHVLDTLHASAVLEADEVEALCRGYAHEGSHSILPAEDVEHGRQRQVGNTVAVVGEEHLLTLQKRLNRLELHTDVGVEAGIHECDLPILDVAGEEIDLTAALAHDKIVGDGLVILEEVLLDAVGLIAKAQDEVLVAEMRVVSHHVPEDRPVADGDQGLRDGLGIIPESHAEAATEKNDFHRFFPFIEPSSDAAPWRRYPSTACPSPSASDVLACIPIRV